MTHLLRAIIPFLILILGACQTTTGPNANATAFQESVEAGIENTLSFTQDLKGVLGRCERYLRSGSAPTNAIMAREGYRPVEYRALDVPVFAKVAPGQSELRIGEAPSIGFHTEVNGRLRACSLITSPKYDTDWLSILVTGEFRSLGYTPVRKNQRTGVLTLRKGNTVITISGERDRRGAARTVISTLDLEELFEDLARRR